MQTEIWQEFVTLVKRGALANDRIRAYNAVMQEALPRHVQVMREKADWREWQVSPEMHLVEDQVHFLLPLTFDGQRKTFCFSFLVEEGCWYWQHVESIVLRLDRLGPLPVTSFPDLPERKKTWMREEVRITEQVRLFRTLAEAKGSSYAFDWFKDGAGYALAARTWVPFVPPSRAFVLYACWEQANLRGNPVTLLKLDEQEALLEIQPLYFELYRETGHLREQIRWQEYKQLYETVWHDRAAHAGWELEITYDGEKGKLYFRRRLK
jgi:hypothetical protein